MTACRHWLDGSFLKTLTKAVTSDNRHVANGYRYSLVADVSPMVTGSITIYNFMTISISRKDTQSGANGPENWGCGLNAIFVYLKSPPNVTSI